MKSNYFLVLPAVLAFTASVAMATGSQRVSAEELTLVGESVATMQATGPTHGRGTGRGIGTGRGRGTGRGNGRVIGFESIEVAANNLPTPQVALAN